MVYASAGQRGYLLHADRSVTVLDSTSLPLGVDEATQVPTMPPILLRPGDVLLLLTDGLVEAVAADKQRFGVDRALEMIQEHRERPAAEIIAALRQRAR